MLVRKCDICKKKIKDSFQNNSLHLVSDSGDFLQIDLCKDCSRPFVKLARTKLPKKFKKNTKK